MMEFLGWIFAAIGWLGCICAVMNYQEISGKGWFLVPFAPLVFIWGIVSISAVHIWFFLADGFDNARHKIWLWWYSEK